MLQHQISSRLRNHRMGDVNTPLTESDHQKHYNLTMILGALSFLVVQVLAHSSEEENVILPIQNPNDPVGTIALPIEASHWHAFFASLASIFVSEIGDRTFFVAAIMAMRYNKTAVFSGAASALVLMTFISCLLGSVVPKLIPKLYTQILAMVLFFYFGGRLLYEYFYGQNFGDEKKEVELEMQQLHNNLISSVSGKHNQDAEVEGGVVQKVSPSKRLVGAIPFQTVAWQAFTLTFVGEWGDRSQISTITLSAVQHVWIVFLGGSLGHLICTTIAVVSGELVSDKISERTVNLIGGVLFSFFGLVQAYVLLTGDETDSH